MINWKTAGLLLGILFGVVFIWQGAGDAGLVLLFGVVGWLVFAIAWFVARVIRGDVDLAAIRELIAAITSGRTGR